jgi:heme A synthase
VTFLTLLGAGLIWRSHGGRYDLQRGAWLLILLVATQVSLGALVVLSGKQPIINTLHVATGALVLATSLVVTLRAFRLRCEPPVPAA